MLVVGLTGGIGSGKSAVSELFTDLGASIIDTDIIARQLTEPHQHSFHEIVSHFGTRLVTKKGELDRKKLRDIIFKDEKERRWLENLLHPYIREAVASQLKRITTPYCLLVVPLLFEVAPFPYMDRILVVDTLPENQIERILKRDKMTIEEAIAILKSQTTREVRLRGADDIIINNGTLADLKPQVEKLHKAYLELAKD